MNLIKSLLLEVGVVANLFHLMMEVEAMEVDQINFLMEVGEEVEVVPSMAMVVVNLANLYHHFVSLILAKVVFLH